jgi:hypothetical protein
VKLRRTPPTKEKRKKESSYIGKKEKENKNKQQHERIVVGVVQSTRNISFLFYLFGSFFFLFLWISFACSF